MDNKNIFNLCVLGKGRKMNLKKFMLNKGLELGIDSLNLDIKEENRKFYDLEVIYIGKDFSRRKNSL